jgi:two-component system sensor histidine kinase VanS
MIAGGLLLAVVLVFLLRYVPDAVIERQEGMFIPNRSDLWRAFAPKAALAMAGLLVVGLAGGWWLAGRMLAPLARITRATRRAATGSLSHRIELDGRQDEFRELADSFDHMLARLEAQVAEQQRFAANASHELRTPLATTQLILEVARQDPDRDPRELIDRLHAVNARAITLTEALLTLSRADQRAFTRDRVDLSLLAEEAVEMLLPLAEKHGVTIETVGAVTPTTGSRSLLLQLQVNLLHNAIVHNLPEAGHVLVTTAAQGGTVTLTVENTGDPLPAALIATLTEPFQRGTARLVSDQAGVGLGLAIVKSITEAHDGALTIGPGRSGGLTVTVALPAAGPGGPDTGGH